MNSLNLIEQINKVLFDTISKETKFILEYKIDLSTIVIKTEKSRDQKFGDYSTNAIMLLGFDQQKTMDFANIIAHKLLLKFFYKVEVVAPGFINMWVNNYENFNVINAIENQKEKFGCLPKTKLLYNIEFVSANPTGLLHIGHARNAAIGNTLVNIWKTCGINVNTEYYINDAGNQIDLLGYSTCVRYLQACGKQIELLPEAYHGQEVIDIGKQLFKEVNNKYLNVKLIENRIEDKEISAFFSNYAKKYLLEIIKQTLKAFGVTFDIWSSEQTIKDSGLIEKTLNALKEYTFEKEGALFLKTTQFGDDKDRVLIKSNKTNTYFLPDIAYHVLKLSRGYNKIFNIWGADHKAYSQDIKIAMEMLGFKAEKIEILIMQMVRLVKNKQEFKMSKRSGVSLTVQDLLDTIGKDAARWYMVAQAMTSHIEIDVDKATKKSNDNPLYYVQYAYARINQMCAKASYELPKNFYLLTNDYERDLIGWLNIYQPTLIAISKSCEVHKLCGYLLNLARSFHAFYTNNIIIDKNNEPLSSQRYYLAKAVKQVIANGLKLIGVSAWEKM
ncbi:MAG: arginine--tRNA ligase [Mycoplasmataceae bacterium]|nr:arginine--tRNA ligase [Mycoplasmataceae bacterium]